jgi:hypothetical protein
VNSSRRAKQANKQFFRNLSGDEKYYAAVSYAPGFSITGLNRFTVEKRLLVRNEYK